MAADGTRVRERPALRFLGLLLVSVATLWSIDVLVNLGVLRDLSDGAAFPFARIRDFFGLFIAVIPLGVVVGLGAVAGGPIAARLLRSDEPARESLALLAGGLAALGVLVPLGWPPTPWTVLCTAGIGFVSFLGIRLVKLESCVPTFGRSQLLTAFPALALAFLADALTRERPARYTWIALLALLGVGLTAVNTRNGRLRQLLGCLPVLASVGVATALAVAGAHYGEPPHGSRLAGRTAAPTAIVLIVLDTVRADHLAVYGYERNTMPALEKWARRAVVVKRAVSSAGWTAPSHASIFSGLRVSAHGIHYASDPAGHTGTGNPVLRTRARAGVRWLPERLRKHGYRTLAVTANLLAVPDEVRGFDVLLEPTRGDLASATLGRLTDLCWPLWERISERLQWRMPYVDAEGIVDIATRAAQGVRPLFLFVNMVDAHSPYNPPEEALRLLDLSPGHVFGRYHVHQNLTRMWPSMGKDKHRYLSALYDGELRFLDLQLARLLDWVDIEFGDDALVVVTADHGEELGEDGRVGHEYGLAQSLIHVPLLIRGPGLSPGTIEAPVSLRALPDLILAAASHGHVAIRDLVRENFPVISERYPSTHNASTLGDDYLRPWVAAIEDDLKVVGPSSAGVRWTALDPSDFDEVKKGTLPERGRALSDWIDAYWLHSWDRRGEHADQSPGGTKLEQLRALGYVK